MGTSNGAHIMTLVNSIIGVSILAMPFCYKQCGIVLASLILIFSNLMTRLSCHYLLKSAIMTRRRTYEVLAFHALGGSGKTAVELSIILLMIGTCIAFFVVMGDLGPEIIGPLIQMEYSAALRPAVLIGLGVLVVLPLGLLRNVDSLSSICTASFLFYLLLVMKVFSESMDNLFLLSWVDEVHFWRPAGILQCLPIFSMALSCQTQLLEIFDSVQNGTLDKMNSIVKSAVNLCTTLYMAVGFLGYIAYYKQSFSGNLLMSFSASHSSELMKMGFVLSVAVTFPLVIFPCRSSLHSLLFKKMHTTHYELVSGGGNHIPEVQFKCITFFIITSSLVVGLLAPNIEIVLGLLGSTIGVIICILCPPFIFMWISNKATTEKILAQALCAVGLFIMVMGTYANLYLTESAKNVESVQNWKNIEPNVMQAPVDVSLKQLKEKSIENVVKPNIIEEPLVRDSAKGEPKSREKKSEIAELDKKISAQVPEEKKDDTRIEPPIPQDPESNKAASKIQSQIQQKEEVKPPPNRQLKDEANDSKIASVDASKKKNQKLKPKKILSDSNIVNNDVKFAASKSLNNDKDRVANKVVDSKKVVSASNAKELRGDGAVVAQFPLNEAQKLAKEQPPLPLLVKAQSNSERKEKAFEDLGEDNILGNKPGVVDREKRDLEYVTNASKIENMKTLQSDVKIETANSKIEHTLHGEDSENSFVKKVAENNKVEACKKVKSTSAETENKTKFEEHLSKTENMDGKLNLNSFVLSESVREVAADKIVKSKEVEVTANEKNLNDPPSKLSDVNIILTNVDPKAENVHELKESLIMAPSKLTNPELLLQHKLYADEQKPVVMDVLKSISRDLKAVEKETARKK